VSAPLLWHLKVSNFNEKARWALDYKEVPHVRRAAVPGQHRKIAKRLAGTSTFPVLELDGEVIGDSTEIIAALERRFPEPPLYPTDPDERRRALELEGLFDEQLGPAARLLFLHHALPDANLMLGAFVPDMASGRRLLARALFGRVRRGVKAMYAIDEQSVARSYDQVRSVATHFRSELGSRGYLVGDRFTVADLTAAALIAPIVAPPQFQYPQPQRDHPRLAPLRAALAEHGLVEWAQNMYARHRGRSWEVTKGADAER
jgi:glutathione S-transferase